VTTKRGRGRPRGARKLPDEYQADLVNLLHYWQSNGKHSLSAICAHIIKQGGVRWVDNKTGKTVAEITNVRSLRSRLVEATKWYVGLKGALSTVKHPRAAEFSVLPIKFGLAVERRRKLAMVTVKPPPKNATTLRVGKKDIHRRA
jgi:hypothetical protein